MSNNVDNHLTIKIRERLTVFFFRIKRDMLSVTFNRTYALKTDKKKGAGIDFYFYEDANPFVGWGESARSSSKMFFIHIMSHVFSKQRSKKCRFHNLKSL